MSFNPGTIPAPGSGNSTMTITVGSSTPTGTYPITVTGNGGGVQQSTTVNLTVTTQQYNYDVGIDFRGTQNYVSDPAYAVFDNCVNDGTNQQTRTNSNGQSVSWQWSQKCNAATNESASIDPRLAGIASVYTASGGETLTITVPQAGIYNIGFATGNAAGGQCGAGQCPNFIFQDGASGTQLFTVNPNNPGKGHFIDAANNNWTAAQWPANNQEQVVTLTGTTLTVSMASGNAPSIAHVRVTYAQQQQNFSMSASPNSLTIQQGNQGTSTITSTISGGFDSAISLSASGAPSGTTVNFNPSSIPAPGNGSSTMTITVGSTTPTGTYPITVTGTGGGIKQTTTVTLTVTSSGGGANFALSASPASLSVGQGNQGTSTITTTVSGGFNSSISLSSSGAPSGTTVSFNPASIAAPGAGTSTMTITVGNSTPTGTYPITVTGNGGGIQRTTTVTLTVTSSGGQSPSDADFMQAYSYTLQATFGKAPYTYQLTSGSLPAGLTLNQSGLISGIPTAVGSSAFQVLVTDSSSPPQQQTFNYTLNVVIGLDTYGGLTAVSSKNGATGFFRMEKQNGRWVFVSPLGNDFYLRSMFHATEAFIEPGIMQQRYNNDGELWAAHAHQRMLSYGFNTLGEYTSQRGLPVGTWGSQNNANPVKLPFILFFDATSDIVNHPTDVGLTEPFKNIVDGIPQSTYPCSTNYCGQLMDVFDPAWQIGYQGELALQNQAITGGFASVPWIVAITTEDADYFWAIKGVGTDPVTPYPNPGWLIAVTNFQQTNYQDTKLYSKYAWTTYLQNKYGNIGALNSAWNTGGFYTSFGDAGGYGTGTGVLDEDGRHKWVGSDSYNLTGETSAMQADINAFLYQYVYQLESVAVNTIKSYDPNHLIVCPSALGGLGEYGIRPPVLQALVDAGVDIVQIGYDPLTPQNISTATAAYTTTGKPVFLWYGLSANQDSYWHGHKPVYHAADYPTQPKHISMHQRPGRYLQRAGLEWRLSHPGPRFLVVNGLRLG